jgi:hypothetical protein
MITDPCPWSPDSPSLYELRLDLGEGQPLLTQSFGIRRFGVRRHHLYLNGKRTVVRGVFDEHYSANAAMWRGLAAVRVLQHLDSDLLCDASREGILSVVRFDEKTTSFPLRAIAAHVSTPLVVLPAQAVFGSEQRGEVPNLLVAQRMESLPPHPWANVAWIEFSALDDFAARIAGLTLPIIAVRRGNFTSLAEARIAIDTLQADMAPIGQFAGYVV